MSKIFNTGLKSKLRDFAEKFSIDIEDHKEQSQFEDFVNYTIISNILNEDFDEPNSISTGKSRGIDGIGIIINNRVINEESKLETIGDKEKLNIRLCFIQATTQSSFSLHKFQSFTDEVVNFLNGNNIIEPFSDILSKLFSEEERYSEQMLETPRIDLYFCSGKTKHTLSDGELEVEENKIKNREDFPFSINLGNIHFVQEEELKNYYEKIDTFLKIPIKFNSEIQLDETEDIPASFICTLKYSELKKIIATESGKGFLRDKLFVENVRSKIENSEVNNDILSTLHDDNKRTNFIYLNNGITILCEKVARHPTKKNHFELKHPRIINGCQTSHMLYEYSQNEPSKADEVEIIAKVISTSNALLKKDIIYATNNQNAIDRDLETLNDFHSKLEEYFNGSDLFSIYFERLRGQYSEIVPPYKVLTKELIAKSYIAIILKEPHLMKSNATSKIDKYIQEGKIFNNETKKLEEYYYSGVLYYLLQKVLSDNTIGLKSKTMDMHLLLACDLKLTKMGHSLISEKLKFLSDNNHIRNIFIETSKELEKQDYLFERRGFYSGPKTKELIKYYE